MNRYLLAIPVIFAASISAAACSSSSSPATGTGTDASTNPACATLAKCCGTLSGSLATECTSGVAAGGATCTADLTTLTGGGYCKGGSSSGTGTGVGTGVGTGSGTGKPGSGTGTGVGTGSGTGTSGTATCAAPGAVPAGFVPPTGLIAPACTAAQTTALGQDEVTDGGGNFSTIITTGAPDGSLNACGNCVQGPILEPGMPLPTVWGASIGFAPEATAGDPMSLFQAFNSGSNVGGCVIQADPTPAGKTCGLDIMALTACEFATCLPLCAVTNMGASSSDFTNLFDCINTAQSTSCASYLTTTQTDCTKIVNDAGTDALDKCQALVNTDDMFPDSGTATAVGESALLGLICGGADAGF